ncbi:MAG: UDP-N-acetylglucosamine--N-acetylmuramyl-(pentapeptide) pyrophosphoryl-undecaprenol N-acetylglucosamine transferase [Candidatus Beckwithbacteria bacterium]|nr:UDP-N-acetylglucosamine--N-acetylmuramyl-(pentapeptide) pyrophosphoryl-undecaprenol N-acetylglucosamine transferase [Patescibacteria group bacterium]
MNKKIVITGTHITPALALIAKLKDNSYQVYYIGKSKSFDKKIIVQSKVNFIAINTPKFKRHQVILSILKSPLFILSLFKSIKILTTIKPKLVLSFGGFVALPVCLAAKVLKIKLIIHEQTLKAGLTNKLTAPLADKIAISWPQNQKYYKKTKTVLTGNPVRAEFLRIKSHQPKAGHPLAGTIYITGGSQGSLVINQVINKILKTLLKKYFVIHQFGLAQDENSWQQALDFKDTLPQNLKSKYILKQWFTIKELSHIFKQTDIMISRSGINTVTEALLLKIKSILIPLPYTQKNEQLNNANFLKNQGLAIVLTQKNLNSKTLLTAINSVFKILPKKSNSKKYNHLIKQATDNLFNLIK